MCYRIVCIVFLSYFIISRVFLRYYKDNMIITFLRITIGNIYSLIPDFSCIYSSLFVLISANSTIFHFIVITVLLVLIIFRFSSRILHCMFSQSICWFSLFHKWLLISNIYQDTRYKVLKRKPKCWTHRCEKNRYGKVEYCGIRRIKRVKENVSISNSRVMKF